LHVTGFKSLVDVDVNLPRLTVLFGTNAAGKSNLLDAAQALSRVGTSRTLSDALAEPIRGYPIEQFAFPEGGLPTLLSQSAARFSLEADLEAGGQQHRYKVEIEIQPGSGALSVRDENLATLSRDGEAKGHPTISRTEDGRQLSIRRKNKGHPRQEPVGQNHTSLSDPRLSGPGYTTLERCRNELSGWRIYYLDPRVAMRTAKPPADVRDIGVLGEDIAPFLYRLNGESSKAFDAIRRTLHTLIPSVDDLKVDLDKRRGTLDILIKQGGVEYSSRIISEGTLRVMALCAIAVSPWAGSLVAFEEPENGVHPRRLELIAELLTSLAIQRGKQVLVTTHSPLFCGAILRKAVAHPQDIALLNVKRGASGTEVKPFGSVGPLFDLPDVAKGLLNESEDGVFERLILRGQIDG
jgi:predicted ATPase